MPSPFLTRRQFATGLAWTAAGIAATPPVWAARRNPEFSADADAVRDDLRRRILPYWLDTAVDWEGGGYQLADDAVKGRGKASEKQIVTQARLIWGFSLAHRKGYGDTARDYRKAAAHGVTFLRQHLQDPEHGGYYFSVKPDGQPLNPRKLLYGQAFVIYGLVEYFRATRDRAVLKEALALFRLLQRRAHDDRHRGWNEHFERDWTPVPTGDPNAIVELAGYKSANTHLHLMEAFTELYAETRDGEVRGALVEALELNREYFYPAEPAKSAFHFHPDWQPSTDARSAGLSYGHNVEFAWLMVRAVEVLGTRPVWPHFHAHLEHALRCGTDHELGGVYNRGAGDGPATDTDKVWWVQAEMLAALLDGLRNRPGHPPYVKALRQLIDFTVKYQTDPRTGIWYDTVTQAGVPKSTGLAHAWKGNYHDVRALVRMVDAMK
jgi:mannose/cellobiose epimerase-like protein (N-acyl-D-glucosamine 2-epimerase family)